MITVGVSNPAIPSALDLPDMRSAASATTTNIRPVRAAPEEPVITSKLAQSESNDGDTPPRELGSHSHNRSAPRPTLVESVFIRNGVDHLKWNRGAHPLAVSPNRIIRFSGPRTDRT